MFDELNETNVAMILTIIGALTTMAVTIIRELRGLRQDVVQSVTAQTSQMAESDRRKIELSREIAQATQATQATQAVPLAAVPSSPSNTEVIEVLERVVDRLGDLDARLTDSLTANARAQRAEANR